ncbi:hypothetical protein VIN30_01120 [Adlercreutzia sp. R7]|uniref:DUF4825 domain-containing protein n=1 Tax=Adlercreutzia wanghongyangiae TaxID=3111451 RepID=A0ABU6IF32_9ACTN|nr:hypothetical protein [Adlercreutzia sp. R7]
MVIAVSVTAAIVAACVIFNVVNGGKNNESDTTDATNEVVVNPYSLPDIDSVSMTDSPILYDFVSGCVGLNEDIVPMVGIDSYFIIISKEDSSRLFVVMNYGNQSEDEINNLLPVFSSSPIRVNLNEEQFKTFNNEVAELENDGDIKSYKEGDYTFYVIPYSIVLLDSSNIEVIDFKQLMNDKKPGDLAIKISDGMGIPTEIIRSKCDVQRIKEISGIDFNDSFWDNVNYNAHVKLHKRSGSEYCIISPIYKRLVAGYGDPINMFTVNGDDKMMTVENLSDYLGHEGYEPIDQALKAKDYATQDEVDEKHQQGV